MKDRWNGTLVFIGQPAEEIGSGAAAHARRRPVQAVPASPTTPWPCTATRTLPAGHVAYTDGLALANVDSVDITVHGKGGHGAAPHTTIDPIVLAARIVLDLQTLVSRETNPLDPAVVTVGSIHGGTKHNIIPNEVKLQLTVRTFKPEVRKHLLAGIAREVEGRGAGRRRAEGAADRRSQPGADSVYNDPELTARMVALRRARSAPGT